MFDNLRHTGLEFRRFTAGLQQTAKDVGVPWDQFVALSNRFGVPGQDPTSQSQWLALVNQASTDGSVEKIDPSNLIAIINAIIAALPGLLAICPK